jgi:hypothetical protein
MNSNFNTVFLEKAMGAFTAILLPITALSYTATSEAYSPGDVVKVPYCQNASGSATFSYETGYNTNGNIINVKNVTLDNLVYQKFALTDTDSAKLNVDAISKLAVQAGERLASDVIATSLSSVVTNANFPTSASCVHTALTSSNSISDLVLQADNAKWPVDNRNLILNPTAWNYLIKNTALNSAFSYGGSQVIQDGLPAKVQGFNCYKTTATLPNSCKGLVLNPNGILTAFGVHKASENAKMVTTSVATDKNGLTIGLRTWYNPDLATSYYTLECLFGNAAGNGDGVFQMK